jgi:hypothetical protein
MSHSGNKSYQLGRYSSTSTDENNHSINNAASLSSQSFVDDIPFEFNPKYRTIIVSNIDIPEYDTTKIRDILSRSVDFTLENKVLLEALGDLQRKKKEIEADTLHQQVSASSATVNTNGPTINSVSIVSNTLPENVPYSITLPPPPPPPPPLTHLPNSQPTVHLPIPTSIFPVTPAPAKPTISPSYRLPSVRDIYWPTGNQQQYVVPPSTLTTNMLNLPTPIHSTNSSPNSVKQTNRSFNNCDSTAANDLAATFDGTLGSNDPFHDAELQSLNDATELRHLYSAIGSANTVRR